MNTSNGKRRSSDDINQRRKRKRTISNDLLRGLDLTDRTHKPASDSSFDSSELESDQDSDYLDENKYVQSAANRKCTKCDDLSHLMAVHNEVLSLLKEIKRDNEKIHKSLTLHMQMCRQEIEQHVRELKNSVTRLVAMTTNGTLNKDTNEMVDNHDVMDEDCLPDDYNEFDR